MADLDRLAHYIDVVCSKWMRTQHDLRSQIFLRQNYNVNKYISVFLGFLKSRCQVEKKNFGIFWPESTPWHYPKSCSHLALTCVLDDQITSRHPRPINVHTWYYECFSPVTTCDQISSWRKAVTHVCLVSFIFRQNCISCTFMGWLKSFNCVVFCCIYCMQKEKCQ